MRIGHGYDVHAFGNGDHIMLCGVRIAHQNGLMAHSDGDVAHDLLFLGASVSRYPLEGYREKCETAVTLGTRYAEKPLELDIPITIAGIALKEEMEKTAVLPRSEPERLNYSFET